MKVAVVTHYYPPEPCAGAARVAALVQALDHEGHDVTVVTCFPSFPRGRFYSQRRPLRRIEREPHARVVRLASWLPRRLPGSRAVHWLSAAMAASLHLLFARDRYDVVIVSSPPITLAIPALVGAFAHGARLVVDVRDVYPDVAIAMGLWKSNGLAARAVEWLARRLYARAQLIASVTPKCIAQIAGRGVDASRLMLIRNAPDPVDAGATQRAADSGVFTAVFAGNLGVAADLDVVVDAAKLLTRDAIAFRIVGDGAQRPHLERRVRDESISNIAFTGSLPRTEAIAVVANADVSIVSLRKGIADSAPTKLYDALSVGCPVVVAAEGEARTQGEAVGAVCTPPGDAPALAMALRDLSRLERSTLRGIGERGRAWVAAYADRSRIMAELAARISALESQKGPHRASL